MHFTLWHRGVLVGQTDLLLGGLPGGSRAGVFQPAPSGMTILPALTAMAPALLKLSEAMARLPLSEEDLDRNAESALEAITSLPEGRRMLAAAEQMIDLELRDPTGKPVPYDSILLSDLHALTELGVAHRAVGDLAVSSGEDPVRYVISVTIRTAWAGGGLITGRPDLLA